MIERDTKGETCTPSSIYFNQYNGQVWPKEEEFENMNSSKVRCIKSEDCDHPSCLHKESHEKMRMGSSNSSSAFLCRKGSFCYYRNIEVYCREELNEIV